MKIQLSNEEALVLLEWLYQRNQHEDIPEYCFEHIAEKIALWNLECLLESLLPDVAAPDYQARVKAARNRLASDYETTKIKP